MPTPLSAQSSDRDLFCSSAVLDPWTYFLHLSLSSVILIDSSTGSPVHVLMLSIQAVRGLPCLRAPACIISFSRQRRCLVVVNRVINTTLTELRIILTTQGFSGKEAVKLIR